MQALKIQKQIDSEILYLPEFRNMLGKHVEIIILTESENVSEEKDRLAKDTYDSIFSDASIDREQPDSAFFISRAGYENRQLLESVNAAYDDVMPDTEDQMLRAHKRRFHRRLIMENEQW